MNSEYELNRLRKLRDVYDRTFITCDPITHMWRLQALLQEIAEHLIQPLQQYEMAERSKLPKKRTRKKNEK
ncbi:MAG TPA: hypothetical protein VGK47_11350 [Nitrososphaeraceae archaeon]